MKKSIILICFLGLVLAGCTYPLKIINTSEFQPAFVKTAEPIAIGFPATNDGLINSVIAEVSLNAFVKDVKKGYRMGMGLEVDYVCDLSYNLEFRASKNNALITFPGFLLFAHAWAGYMYHIELETRSRILDPNGEVLSIATISTPYVIRYTSFARGATSSLVGWVTPGYGILDIIPALIYSSKYDDRATEDFLVKVEPSYKAYVSSKVLEQIISIQQPGASGLNKTFKAETRHVKI